MKEGDLCQILLVEELIPCDVLFDANKIIENLGYVFKKERR